MNKSDIVVSIFLARSEKKTTAQQVKKLLQSELGKFQKDIEDWDQEVNTPIANAIIKNIGSTRGELSMELLITDIDLILKRIS
jgi:hypothetical protein